MRALLMPGDRRVELTEVRDPEPGEGEVVVDMRAAGLCGSDLHMQYRPPASERRGEVYGLRTDPDVVPGHEIAGVVSEVGPGVVPLRTGDRVAVHHMGGCGHCRQCRTGWDINCPQKWGTYGLDVHGGMQDRMVARARDCVRVPDAISLAEASYYACGAGTGYLALKRGSLGLGDVVAVVGLGPVGLAAAFFAARSGALVLGFDTQPERGRFAEEQGVCVALDPRDADTLERVADLTDGHGADVVVEATGMTSARSLALELVALHGRVVCVGFSHELSELPLQRGLLQKQADVRGAWMFPIHALDATLRSVAREGVSITRLMPGRHTLEAAGEAWTAFDRGSLGKTTIVWPGEDS